VHVAAFAGQPQSRRPLLPSPVGQQQRSPPCWDEHPPRGEPCGSRPLRIIAFICRGRDFGERKYALIPNRKSSGAAVATRQRTRIAAWCVLNPHCARPLGAPTPAIGQDCPLPPLAVCPVCLCRVRSRQHRHDTPLSSHESWPPWCRLGRIERGPADPAVGVQSRRVRGVRADRVGSAPDRVPRRRSRRP
jgi:hypothetical protein